MEATSTAGRAGAPPAAPPPRAFTTKKQFYAQFKKKSIAHELWLRFLKNRTAVAGLIIFSVIAIVAITAPWIADYDAVVTKIDIAARLQPPSSSVPNQWLALGGWRRAAMSILVTTAS